MPRSHLILTQPCQRIIRPQIPASKAVQLGRTSSIRSCRKLLTATSIADKSATLSKLPISRPGCVSGQYPFQPSSRNMSTSTSPDPAIAEILDFWFVKLSFDDWFMKSAAWDKEITERFGELVNKARTSDELDATWLDTASGSLAMIILLDQFTRNIYRPGNHPDPGLSWSGDAKALRIANDSITKGFDRQVQTEYAHTSGLGLTHRYFFYMPYMHAEDLTSQIASCALFELMGKEAEATYLRKKLEGQTETEAETKLREWLIEGSVPFALKHRNCVATLGRFPKRNEPLGRPHSEEEKKWLEEHPAGF